MGTKRRRRNEAAPGWAWMLLGLSIGLAVALVVYLKSGVPTAAPGIRVTTTESTPMPTGTNPESVRAEAGPANQSSAEREATPQEGLGFYTDLRELEVIVPEGEFDFDAGADVLSDVVIQAGAFPDMQRADARQAELAFLGIEAQIQPAIVDGRRFYRVIIGPLSQRERGRINEILRQLTEKGIESFPRLANE